MHPITAKLITLERVEAFVTVGWPKGARSSLREEAQRLRRELPPHMLTVFDRLKAEGKKAVVAVFEGKCGGCQAPLSRAALARSREEADVSCCEQCGRFVYLAAGHYVVPNHAASEQTGSLTTRGVVP